MPDVRHASYALDLAKNFDMLAVKTYSQDYIDACRARVESQLAGYRMVMAAKRRASVKDPTLDKAFEAFESAFFNNMVIVLESSFVHRLRTVEGKDGNPLNEVRVLASSMMLNNETVMADSTVKMKPAKSILKLEVGDDIRLNEDEFVLLFEAFIAEIERKFAS